MHNNEFIEKIIIYTNKSVGSDRRWELNQTLVIVLSSFIGEIVARLVLSPRLQDQVKSSGLIEGSLATCMKAFFSGK